MPELSVIQHLQVFKDSLLSLTVIGPVLPVGTFPFYGGKEALYQRMILAVAFAAHAHFDPPRRLERLILAAGGLSCPDRNDGAVWLEVRVG